MFALLAIICLAQFSWAVSAGNFTDHAPTREAATALLQANGINVTILDPGQRDRLVGPINGSHIENDKLAKRCDGSCTMGVSGWDFAIVDIFSDDYNPTTCPQGCTHEHLVSLRNGEAPQCSSESEFIQSGNGGFFDMCSKNQYVGTQPGTGNWIYTSYCENGGYNWGTTPSVFYLNWSWGEVFAYCYPSNWGTYCKEDNGININNFATVAWCNWY